MWCDYPFNQQNKATERAVGVEDIREEGGQTE